MDNKALQRTIFDHFNNDRFDDVLQHAADDVVIEMIALGQIHRGHRGFRDSMHGFKGAFPNLRIELKSQVTEGARVVAELVARGTHTGPLITPAGAVPPTNREVTFTVCEVWEIKDGKLGGIRNYQDIGSVLRQLGIG